MAKDGTAVDDSALQRGHERAAHDGHHKEGRAERGVLQGDVFQRDIVNRREHQAHENANAHQTVESRHADDKDGPEGTKARANPENGQQLPAVHVFHQERGNKSSAEEQNHGHDVVVLRRGFVNSKIVCILDDECPGHDLGGDVENLGKNTFAIDFVAPEVGEGLTYAVLFFAFAGGVRHLHQRDDYQHDKNYKADSDVWRVFDISYLT